MPDSRLGCQDLRHPSPAAPAGSRGGCPYVLLSRFLTFTNCYGQFANIYLNLR